MEEEEEEEEEERSCIIPAQYVRFRKECDRR
jgi:hypothetical protein